MHLGELASVRSGLVLARKESREPTPYCYNLLTLRSIHPDGSIAQEDLSVFSRIGASQGKISDPARRHYRPLDHTIHCHTH